MREGVVVLLKRQFSICEIQTMTIGYPQRANASEDNQKAREFEYIFIAIL